MTKTLTEQWREGTLPAGYYYIIANTKARNEVIFYLPENTNTDGAVIKGEVVNGEDGGWVVEVLGHVPRYEQFIGLMDDSKELDKAYDKINLLEKRLEIATKALKEYDNKLNWDIRGVSFMKYNKGFTIARKALKEMEGVK